MSTISLSPPATSRSVCTFTNTRLPGSDRAEEGVEWHAWADDAEHRHVRWWVADRHPADRCGWRGAVDHGCELGSQRHVLRVESQSCRATTRRLAGVLQRQRCGWRLGEQRDQGWFRAGDHAGANDAVPVDSNDDIVCTITNTRLPGSIELKKVWSGTPGQTTLNIGTSAGGSQDDTQPTGADGAAPLTTGANSVPNGTYYVSETGGLSNYSSSLACFNDNGAGGGSANNGIKDGSEPAITPVNDAVARRLQ